MQKSFEKIRPELLIQSSITLLTFECTALKLLAVIQNYQKN